MDRLVPEAEGDGEDWAEVGGRGSGNTLTMMLVILLAMAAML